MSNEEMRKMKSGSQERKEARQFTEEEIVQIQKERDSLDSLYYLGRMINCIEGVNIILKKRYDFYEKYELPLQEFVLWGKYLLTYRGTMQEIYQCKYFGSPPKITTIKDFMMNVNSFRRRELNAFPPRGCFCAKCHAPITMDDVIKGNYIFVYNEFTHKEHNEK